MTGKHCIGNWVILGGNVSYVFFFSIIKSIQTKAVSWSNFFKDNIKKLKKNSCLRQKTRKKKKKEKHKKNPTILQTVENQFGIYLFSLLFSCISIFSYKNATIL